MKKYIWLTICFTLLVAGVSTAGADSIKGRLGVTGQVGFVAQSNSKYATDFATTNGISDTTLKPEASFAGGGGLIFGLTDILALEAHVIYMPRINFNNAGTKVMEIESINASLGVQVRNNVSPDLAAYLGGGGDVLVSDVMDANGNKADVDTVVGGHVNAGADYFITKYLALNLDLRGVFFPEADIKAGGQTVAKYDPIGFVGLAGVRVFLY